AVGEIAHEEAGHDGPAPALARDVVEIRDIALEPVLVLVVEGHPPHLLARGLRRAQDAAGERIIAREDTRHALAEGDHDGAGERGEIDHPARLYPPHPLG